MPHLPTVDTLNVFATTLRNNVYFIVLSQMMLLMHQETLTLICDIDIEVVNKLMVKSYSVYHNYGEMNGNCCLDFDSHLLCVPDYRQCFR